MKSPVFLIALLMICSSAFAEPTTRPSNPATSTADADTVSVKLTGGYETDPRDRGRPVVLVAGGLKVAPEVFRDAFNKVHPAGPDRGPTDDEARRNKQVLMDALAKYGVTNDRLNEVSNFYRYRKESGEFWKHQAAKVSAVIRNGSIASFKIEDAGYGYSSPPQLSVDGFPNVKAVVKLHIDIDLMKNGSIESIAFGG